MKTTLKIKVLLKIIYIILRELITYNIKDLY